MKMVDKTTPPVKQLAFGFQHSIKSSHAGDQGNDDALIMGVLSCHLAGELNDAARRRCFGRQLRVARGNSKTCNRELASQPRHGFVDVVPAFSSSFRPCTLSACVLPHQACRVTHNQITFATRWRQTPRSTQWRMSTITQEIVSPIVKENSGRPSSVSSCTQEAWVRRVLRHTTSFATCPPLKRPNGTSGSAKHMSPRLAQDGRRSTLDRNPQSPLTCITVSRYPSAMYLPGPGTSR